MKTIAATVSVLLLLGSINAGDSEANPQSLLVESTDSYAVGSRYDVRHAIDPGNGDPLEVISLSTNNNDDLAPRIEIQADGDTYVVWYRDGSTDDVLIRRHDYSSGTWSSEKKLSASADAVNPSIATGSSNAWVAFEEPDTITSIIVRKITDATDPIGLTRDVLGSTTYTGELDTIAHSDSASSSLWVTWIDNSADVGWSEYNYTTETWSTTAYEDYSADSIADARARIKTTATN